MENWQGFAVITGGAAAALLGLLFVATSIRADVIGSSPGLRARVTQVLAVFVALLIASIAIALPNPELWILGIELVVVALLLGTALVILGHRAESTTESGTLVRVLDRLNPNVTTSILFGLAGLSLILGFEAGLFLVALAAVVGFVGGIAGAWLVLVSQGGGQD